jgi:hypothetical protein
LHMHALLWGINECFDEPLEYLSGLIHKTASCLTDRRGRSMCERTNVDIKEVFDMQGVIKYVTKDAINLTPDRRTQFWIIDKNGLRYELIERDHSNEY